MRGTGSVSRFGYVKVLVSSLCLITILSLFGCGAGKVNGSYETAEVLEQGVPMSEEDFRKSTFTFTDNYTGFITVAGSTDTVSFSWSQDGDTVCITTKSDGISLSKTETFKLEGNKLISGDDGSFYKVVYKKK